MKAFRSSFFLVLFFNVWGFAGHAATSADVTPAPNTLSFISGSDFKDKVDEAKTPAVLDFWAVWCAPCQVYSPRVEAVSKAYLGKMAFYKVDVSNAENDQRVQGYSIQSIPTLLVIENGQVVERWEGLFTQKELKTKLDKVLKEWTKAQKAKS